MYHGCAYIMITADEKRRSEEVYAAIVYAPTHLCTGFFCSSVGLIRALRFFISFSDNSVGCSERFAVVIPDRFENARIRTAFRILLSGAR